MFGWLVAIVFLIFWFWLMGKISDGITKNWSEEEKAKFQKECEEAERNAWIVSQINKRH